MISNGYCSEFGSSLECISLNRNSVDTLREDLGQKNVKQLAYNLKYCGQNHYYFGQNLEDIAPNIKYFSTILNDFDPHLEDLCEILMI